MAGIEDRGERSSGYRCPTGEIYTALYGKGKGRLELLDGPALILRARLSNFVEPYEEGLTLCGDEVTEGLVAPGRNLIRRPVQRPVGRGLRDNGLASIP